MNNHRIINIQTQVIHIALKTPFITALRRVESIAFVRVKLECSDGSFAIGEAPATKAVTGEDLESIESAIIQVREKLYRVSLVEALDILHKQKIGSSAKAALDMACMALLRPFKLETFQAIKTDITISLNAKEKMLHDAKEALKGGMDILKIKLGSDIDHAIEVTQELSTTLPNAQLLIDANQAWSLEDSLHYVDACSGMALIEQPVVAEDLSGLKTITNATDTPILADEAVFSLEDVKKVVESQSADMINIKLMKCGGVSKAIEILEYAREKQVTCMLGSMLEGPYSINAALYLAFNYRDVIKYVDLDSPLLYKEPSEELDFIFRGAVICPKVPSLKPLC